MQKKQLLIYWKKVNKLKDFNCLTVIKKEGLEIFFKTFLNQKQTKIKIYFATTTLPN